MQALQACRQAVARRTALQHVQGVAAPHLREAAWRRGRRCCPPPEAGRRHRHSQPEPAAPEPAGRGTAAKKKQQDPDAQPGSTGSGGGTPVEPKRVRPLGPGLPNLQQVAPDVWQIAPGYVPGMRVPVRLYASPQLLRLLLEEVEQAQPGGFLPALQQLANVATLPGIVGASTGMPDLHSGYAFAIGHVAAFDLERGVVSPGGVGFDISCGVRLLRTDLREKDLTAQRRGQLADTLASIIPVGVGEGGAAKISRSDLDALLRHGMRWTEERGLSWPEDREVVEEGGCYPGADPGEVSDKAKKRGLKELGSLGSGNHYCEVQVVDQIYDKEAAAAMGIDSVGQVCVMVHTGSRGLGHQVCQDALEACQRHMAEAGERPIDPQLSYVPIRSPEGQAYLKAMAAAANFALCNRAVVMDCVRRAFEAMFGRSARKLGMHTVYDVSHNLAKVEMHQGKKVLVHRKGATRAFPPHHPALPPRYAAMGQPVLIGGSMGTYSYVLAGTQRAMEAAFGSTSHGAGRALSRSQALRQIDSQEVLRSLEARGIAVRVASRHLAAEEAPESYKDVEAVVETCQAAGLSRKVARLRPVAVVKG